MTDASVHLSPGSTASAPEDLTRAVAAPVRDPLWALARQYQTAELHAQDGGSPVGVELSWNTSPLHVIDPTTGGRVPPGATPLQAIVEAEPSTPLPQRPYVELAAAGIELLRTLADHELGHLTSAFQTSTYALSIPGADQSAMEPATRRQLRCWPAHVPDPRLVADAVTPALGPAGDQPGPLGTLPGLPDLSTEDHARLERAMRDWLQWLHPTQTDPPAPTWLPDRLEHTFALSTHDDTTRLRAPEHLGGDLDWYSFVRHQKSNAAVTSGPFRGLPTPVAFSGMPRSRYWELEDGDVNLELLRPEPDNIARLALIAFAHQHSNDWFYVPVDLPIGTATAIRSLRVFTTFGDEPVTIRAAAEVDAEIDGAPGPWQMFSITRDPAAGDDPEPAASPLVLVDSAARHLVGPPVEDLLLLRDEMANLAWAVERTTQDRGGGTIDRFQRHQRLSPPSSTSHDGLRYRLASTVPDFWYPLQADIDQDGQPVLRLATMGMSPTSDIGVAGTILDHDTAAAIRDEEVPREGAVVTRRRHVARGSDGTTHTWTGRAKRTGLGEGSSGLRFDVVAATDD